MGAVVASPAAHAATCQSVPGATPGTDISIGGQPHRVPGVSGVEVCVDTGAVPLVSASFDGRGYCTFACFSVTLPGGTVDAPGLTVTYKLDGVAQSRTVDPGGVPGGPEACLLSVGGPDAPYPTCSPGVAIGPDIDDPTQGLLEAVQYQVEQAEEDVAALQEDAGQAVGDLQEDVDATVDDLNEDLENTVGNLEDRACDAIPPMEGYDPWYGYYYEVYFCDDPVTWLTMASEQASAVACNQIPPQWDPNTYSEVYFCDDAVRWLSLALDDEICIKCEPIDVGETLCALGRRLGVIALCTITWN